MWNALFFSLAVTEWQMSIRTAEVRPYCFFFCFGRGTSVARCDQGGGLALLESCRGFCRSRYDAYNPKSAMKTVHHWRPTLMHLGCMIEMLDNIIFIIIYYIAHDFLKISDVINQTLWKKELLLTPDMSNKICQSVWLCLYTFLCWTCPWLTYMFS